MAKIRVLLADDHAILREGLRALLSYYDDVEVVGEAQDGAQVLSLVDSVRPDIILMDIAMPKGNGIETTRLVRKQFPETRVLILTQHDDRQYIVAILEAGASGYILKRALGSDLVTAIRAVSRGETFLYPDVISTLVRDSQRESTETAVSPVTLTLREREVLRLIALGQTNTQIASALSLSVKTIEYHRSNLMNKLGVHTIAHLVRYALRHGLAE